MYPAKDLKVSKVSWVFKFPISPKHSLFSPGKIF